MKNSYSSAEIQLIGLQKCATYANNMWKQVETARHTQTTSSFFKGFIIGATSTNFWRNVHFNEAQQWQNHQDIGK